MSLTRTLYRNFLQKTRAFRREQLPLTGVVGTRWVAPTPDCDGYIRHLFRRATDSVQGNINEGLHALRQLGKQYVVLQGAVPEARVALQRWATIQAMLRQLPDRQMRCQHAMELTASLMQCLTVDGPKYTSVQNQDNPDEFWHQMYEVAEEVVQAAPPHLLQGRRLRGALGVGPDHLRHLSEVLFRQLKFRNYPFEWVYDGLDPALLHKVVYRCKGMPLSLGSLCVLVGARLGIFLEMKGQPTPPIQLPVDLDLKGRQLRLNTGQEPPPLRWTLCTEGTFDGKAVLLSLDVSRKGEVTVAQHESQVLFARDVIPREANEKIEPQPECGQRDFYLDVWAETARVMVTAHQRRGESDAVAFWMYQAMALDHTAPEWSIYT